MTYTRPKGSVSQGSVVLSPCVTMSTLFELTSVSILRFGLLILPPISLSSALQWPSRAFKDSFRCWPSFPATGFPFPAAFPGCQSSVAENLKGWEV